MKNCLSDIWVLIENIIATTYVVYPPDQYILQNISYNHLTFQVGSIHGHNSRLHRHNLWNDLLNFPLSKSLIIGYFNATLGAHDHRGFRPTNYSLSLDFRQFFENGDFR